MNTIPATGVSYEEVKAAVEQAEEGDTVLIPEGTASWPERLEITKGISLLGKTVVFGAGTPEAIATDLTIILDESPRSQKNSGVIYFNNTPDQKSRVSGLTIKAGTATQFNNNGVIFLSSSGDRPNFTMRVDHCHIDHVRDKMIHGGGWCYGVADHNLLEAEGNSQSGFFGHSGYGGATDQRCDNQWADFPWFGTANFFFFEDNTVIGNGKVTTSGALDSDHGARWVARHNYFKDARPGWHGTEGGRARGTRAVQIYNNVLDSPTIAPSSMNRSGVGIYHDNTYLGLKNQGGPYHCNMADFRSFGAVGKESGTWGSADGTSPWDKNVTDPEGGWTEGDPSHQFAAGTASQSEPEGTLTDASESWNVNQWAGYSVRHPAIKKGAFIISNTEHTITYRKYGATDRGPLIIFNAGDAYEIHKMLESLDQSGRGKGDLLKNDPPTNSVTSSAAWPHQQIEPCFSWNNVYKDGAGAEVAWGFDTGQPNVQEGRDYFNLGKGLPADTIPPEVKAAYPAAVNGADYTAEYVYPHPFVTGEEPPEQPPIEPPAEQLTVTIAITAPPEVHVEVTQSSTASIGKSSQR